MQNTALLTYRLEFMTFIVFKPARSNKSEGSIILSGEPLFRVRLKGFFEVRAKPRETATRHVRSARSVG